MRNFVPEMCTYAARNNKIVIIFLAFKLEITLYGTTQKTHDYRG